MKKRLNFTGNFCVVFINSDPDSTEVKSLKLTRNLTQSLPQNQILTLKKQIKNKRINILYFPFTLLNISSEVITNIEK